jgi:hypothetical protein
MSFPRKPLLRQAAIFLIVAISLSSVQQVHGQDELVVENATVAVDYGKTITFQARIHAPLPIEQASILFRGINEEVTRVETVQVAEDGSVSFTYDASLNVLPPFGLVVFWFQATLTDGKTYTSSPIAFSYNDDRFPWRETSRENVSVHWYAGDDAFGAGALDAAVASMAAINEVMPVALDNPLNIYIYSNVNDLRGTLELGGAEWAGGHANPELGVVLVAIAPGAGQSIEMETEIPHELAHVMMYRALGDGYASQPAWLVEGFASTMELYPNPEYQRALNEASQKDTLLSFEDLCASFPADAGNAFLAYAQSQSFVNYLRTAHGNSGITRLAELYRDGFSCDLGASKAFGVSLEQLDQRWRETVLGQNVAAVAARNLLPFILLMALVLLVPLWGAVDMILMRRKRGQQPK